MIKKVIIFGFTLKILECGDLLPILKIPNLPIFLPTSVNHELGLMCLKNKQNFCYKLHPNTETFATPTCRSYMCLITFSLNM